MKECKLVCGQMWGGKDLHYTVNIPDDVYFYDTEALGHGTLTGCIHYGTVVKTEDHKDWLSYLKKKKLFSWDFDELGEYTVITIKIVYPNKHNLPVKSRDEVLKDIDFHKYVFVYYDKNYKCMNLRRIFKFYSTFGMDTGCITFRDFFSLNEYLSIQNDRVEINGILISPFDKVYSKYKVFEGDEAEIIWNTAIKKVISTNFNYDPSKVQVDYKFEPEYDEWLAKHDGLSPEEYLNKVLENCKKVEA